MAPIRIVGSRVAKFCEFLRIFDEAYVSAQPAPPPAHPWIPRPHADQERPHRLEAPPRERAQTIDCFIVAVKLRRRAEFTKVFEGGIRFRGRFMTCFALSNDAGSPRLGIAASQKMGNAVARNRAKRLVRELFRAHKPLTDIDLIVVPRREIINAPWTNIEADYRAALLRIDKLSVRARR
jgi:ribonuclease P protein component